jgi:hypothetical protein
MEGSMTVNGFWKISSCTVMAVALLAPMVASSPAEARKGYGSTLEEVEIQTQGPVKGYSGSPVGAGPLVYCDYQRIPNRQCTIGANGQERCKIVNWTLKQFCY